MVKLKKERKKFERQTRTQDEREGANPKLQKHVTFPDTPDKIKKVMKERYCNINETGSIYDKKSTEIKDENPFQNTRRELYQDELNDNEESENRSEERNKENKRPLYSEPVYSSEYREAMQKMKSRSRELDETKKGQELELSKMLEQKRQFEIQRQKKLEEEAELQESIEELELKEKEIELNQLKASKLKMEMEAIRKDDECVKKNLKILRLRRCELIERIQLKKTSLETETKEIAKKPKPKIESGISKQDHVFVGKPFVPAFDGKNFEDWKIEVECLVKSKMYPEPLLTQGIRASLK
ncbi:hypothetical protein DPMN_155061 [Dreissena polymorpha]|uniref:Uncharacterized protein n=1 Tax=Dreissena polymorpha TaxID=45954 RepID=A0A9D4J6B5_DREPO|nr:hypothetical protein DPMN_155061 [Dreissena polymorpha]